MSAERTASGSNPRVLTVAAGEIFGGAERQIMALLRDSPGVRPEDVFVNLVEVAKENWSLGHGLAQYA